VESEKFAFDELQRIGKVFVAILAVRKVCACWFLPLL
jgi:hypothetical protein